MFNRNVVLLGAQRHLALGAGFLSIWIGSVGQLYSQTSGPIRVNDEEGAVLQPSPANEYRILRREGTLYVAWTGIVGEETKLFLSTVDLERGQPGSTWRITPGEGNFLAPAIALEPKGAIDAAWLRRLGRRTRTSYEICATTFVDNSPPSQESQCYPYGTNPVPPFMASTHSGTVAVGSSWDSQTSENRVQVLGKTSGGIWQAAALAGDWTTTSGTPVMLAGDTRILLVWGRKGQLVVSSSSDGLIWSEPKALGGANAKELTVVTAKTGSDALVWAEVTAYRTTLFSATFDATGLALGEARKLIELDGTSLRFVEGPDGRKGMNAAVFHYFLPGDGCWAIGSITLATPPVVKIVDGSEGECRLSREPAALEEENHISVVWQMKTRGSSSIEFNRRDGNGHWNDELVQLAVAASEQAVSAPKLFRFGSHLYLSYYTYPAPRRLFPRMTSRGDIIIRRFDGQPQTD